MPGGVGALYVCTGVCEESVECNNDVHILLPSLSVCSWMEVINQLQPHVLLTGLSNLSGFAKSAQQTHPVLINRTLSSYHSRKRGIDHRTQAIFPWTSKQHGCGIAPPPNHTPPFPMLPSCMCAVAAAHNLVSCRWLQIYSHRLPCSERRNEFRSTARATAHYFSRLQDGRMAGFLLSCWRCFSATLMSRDRLAKP